jgi:septum formation protein
VAAPATDRERLVPPTPRLILASASPRRQQLLREAGYDFLVHPADIDEDDHPPRILPSALAQYLAHQKARAVARRFERDVVLAADTVVAFGDRVLGKPEDADDARRMLELLSGTTHIVITGVAVVHAAAEFSALRRVMSAVRMRILSGDEIDRYVAGGQWQGKAGGYGIQDHDPFVTRMAGCHTNIVGLPMTQTRALLARAGILAGLAAVDARAARGGDASSL